jgi:hypothetical protein
VVDCDEFLGDLLPVRAQAARHLVPTDVDTPLSTSALDPAWGRRVVERERLGRQVVGVADVADRVLLGGGIGLVEDRVSTRRAGGAPRTGTPRAIRAGSSVPAHQYSPNSSSSASLIASASTIGQAGRPATAAALVNSARPSSSGRPRR